MLMIMIEDAEPPAVGVTGLGLKDVDTPVRDGALSVTGDVKPLRDLTATFTPAVEFMFMVVEAGETARVKSAILRVRVVVAVAPPPDPVNVTV